MPLDLKIAAESSPGIQLNLWMEEYCRQKREEARQELEALLQPKIESIESQFKGSKQKRAKRFHKCCFQNACSNAFPQQSKNIHAKLWFLAMERVGVGIWRANTIPRRFKF